MEGIQCLERRIYERPLTSEPFIENQSEHISKLSLHQSLVKRKFITKRYRHARTTLMHASLNVGYQGKSGPGKIHKVILVVNYCGSCVLRNS